MEGDWKLFIENEQWKRFVLDVSDDAISPADLDIGCILYALRGTSNMPLYFRGL